MNVQISVRRGVAVGKGHQVFTLEEDDAGEALKTLVGGEEAPRAVPTPPQPSGKPKAETED